MKIFKNLNYKKIYLPYFRVFHTWMGTSFRQSVLMGELLRVHPQFEYSTADKYRLRLNELQRITK
jgi:hypothetical protein